MTTADKSNYVEKVVVLVHVYYFFKEIQKFVSIAISTFLLSSYFGRDDVI
jgi:hypothetical protein